MENETVSIPPEPQCNPVINYHCKEEDAGLFAGILFVAVYLLVTRVFFRKFLGFDKQD